MRGCWRFRYRRFELLSAACATALRNHDHDPQDLHRYDRPQKLIETSHLLDPTPETQEGYEEDVKRKAELLIVNALKSASITCGIAVKVSVNGRTQFRGAYGIKDLENMVEADRDDVAHFTGQVWSVSKPFTAHLWMKFLNDSALGFDSSKSDVHHVLGDYPKFGYVERINRVFSNETFSAVEYFPVQLEELRSSAGQPVKLGAKHFLLHVAGLDLYPEDDHDYRAFNSSTQWFKRYVGSYAKLPYQPVTRFHYSNIGYDLIAVMLERLQPDRFTDYGLAQLASLNITSTDYHQMNGVYMGEFSQYTTGAISDESWVQSNAMVTNMALRSGSAQIASNVDDLDKFGNITARMYKQAFLDTAHDMQKLPLLRSKIREQYSLVEPEGFNEFREWEDYAPGWEQSRLLVNNQPHQRCLRVLVNHSGLGNGVCAYLGVGMHDLDVDRDAEKKAGEQDGKRRRQMDPVLFTRTTIPRCNWKKPVKEEMITRWELPSKTQVTLETDSEWKAYAREYLDAASSIFEDDFDRYKENAVLLLYRMIIDSSQRDNCDRRLRALQACWQRHSDHETWKRRRVEHKIMRRLIGEHWRNCRKEPDSLDDEEFGMLEERAEAFKFDYRYNFEDGIVSTLQDSMDEFEQTRTEIMTHFQQSTARNPRWQADIIGRLEISPGHRNYALTYDINKPFNKLKNEDHMQNNYGNNNHNTEAEDERFKTVELDPADRCSCRRRSMYGTMESEYPEQFEAEPPKPERKDAQDNPMTVDVDAMTGTTFYDPVKCDFKMGRVPASWLPRAEEAFTRQRSDDDSAPPAKRRKKAPEQKWVVVSVICNQNSFDPSKLGRELDALFGQHFCHAPPPPPPPSPRCSHARQEHLCDMCNRSCKSRSGLVSHQRACRRRHANE